MIPNHPLLFSYEELRQNDCPPVLLNSNTIPTTPIIKYLDLTDT